MLRSARSLFGYALHATDGEIGKVEQLLFDDERWGVRYLVVNTGGLLLRHQVLISPIAVKRVNWAQATVEVDLTRKQVDESPDLYSDPPVSRQKEMDYFNYYRWPYYWAGSGLWGAAVYPIDLSEQSEGSTATPIPDEAAETGADIHLRSTDEVIGYHIEATDREFGHLEDLIIEDHSWRIRYLVVDTKNWWPSKSVLVSTEWVEEISWSQKKIRVDLTHEAVKNGPEYHPTASVNREFEERLYDYYGRPKYWSAVEAPPERKKDKEKKKAG
jgi:sporulation protein YlmC with PRC-barrel domain